MAITYSTKKDFSSQELEGLFLSVEWSSGHFPDKLAGMICAMDDGIMNAYVHYLLVNPAYHGRKIGRTLVEKMKERYADFTRIAVIAYNNELSFYENCGFSKADDASPMFITSLWT